MPGQTTVTWSANITRERGRRTRMWPERAGEISRGSWIMAWNLFRGSINSIWRITINRKLLTYWLVSIRRPSTYQNFRADLRMSRKRSMTPPSSYNFDSFIHIRFRIVFIYFIDQASSVSMFPLHSPKPNSLPSLNIPCPYLEPFFQEPEY